MTNLVTYLTFALLIGLTAYVIAAKHHTNKQLRKILMTQAEALLEIQNLKAQSVKQGGETTTLLNKITELLAIIAGGGVGDVTPELSAAIADLKTQMQIVDDLVPDVPPAP